MKLSLARKLLLGALVLALAAGGAFAVLAQDDDATADTETSACAPPTRGDWRGNHLDALAELDMTIAELRDHLASSGTIQELLAESDAQAGLDAARLACIDELEANGDLTAEQAAALRAVIETGAHQAMREALGGDGEGWGKGDRDALGKRGGHGGRGKRGIGGRGFFEGRGIPIMPEFFGGNINEMLEGLLGELGEDGELSDELRERFEQLKEELRSGGRGGLGLRGFRIERGPGGRWHFDWFDNDDADSDEMHDDEDASADNSA